MSIQKVCQLMVNMVCPDAMQRANIALAWQRIFREFRHLNSARRARNRLSASILGQSSFPALHLSHVELIEQKPYSAEHVSQGINFEKSRWKSDHPARPAQIRLVASNRTM
jgi:hypothetical protein